MVKKWVECNRKKSWIEDEGMGGGEGKRGRGKGRGRGWVEGRKEGTREWKREGMGEECTTNMQWCGIVKRENYHLWTL